MKKRVFSSALVALSALFISPAANSQNTTAYWSTTGNNNAASPGVLGTTNSVPLYLATKNTARVLIDTFGRVGIGSAPQNIFTVKPSQSILSSKWSLPNSLFVGFGETSAGNADFVLCMAANPSDARPGLAGRRSRGTLNAPLAVVTNDYLASIVSSGFDGTNFVQPSAIEFFVDSTPTRGNVPSRLSLVTGSNDANRKERLKVGYTGDFNFNSGQMFLQQATGNAGFGTTSPVARMDIRNTTNVNSVYVTNTSTNVDQFGIRSFVNGPAAGSTRIAGEFLAAGDGITNTGTKSSAFNSSINYGGTFSGTGGATTNIGSWGYASGPAGSSNYAVYATLGSGSSGNDWAGYFKGKTYISNRTVLGSNEVSENAQLTVRTPDTSYNAIFASTENGVGNGILSTYSGAPTIYYALWGIAPANNNNQAGYFSGNVTVTGTFTNPSDERLKQNVKPLAGALERVMKVGVHTYDFKPEYSSMNLPQGKQYGYLAQNLEGVFPELVLNTADKTKDMKKPFLYKTVNYVAMIPILTKALQEQHEQSVKAGEEMTALKAENVSMKKRLDDLEAAFSKLLSQQKSPCTVAVVK